MSVLRFISRKPQGESDGFPNSECREAEEEVRLDDLETCAAPKDAAGTLPWPAYTAGKARAPHEYLTHRTS